MVKLVLRPYLSKFKTSLAKYIRVREPINHLHYDGESKKLFVNLKSKNIYITLITKIAIRHYMEKRWSNRFNKTIGYNDWKDIYRRKVEKIVCKKLADFNFKLLHNLIYTGYILSKWNSSISSKCVVCGENDTVEHLLYECSRVKCLWEKVGEILKLKILWHHLVLGLNENNAEQINKTRNNILSIIVYAIFATWVKCGDRKENFKYLNLETNVCNYLSNYTNVFKRFDIKLTWFVKYYSYVEMILNKLKRTS